MSGVRTLSCAVYTRKSSEEGLEQSFNFRVNGESPAVMQRLVAAGNKLGAKWNQLRFAEMRRVLQCFVRKVIIDDSSVQIMVSRPLLRRVLESSDQLPTVEPYEVKAQSAAGDLITLSIQAHHKRCGGEVHLVVSPNLELTTRQPRPSRIKAVVRAHDWHQKVLNGKAFDQRALARQAGLTERYVGKVFACAFLAPDIIEAILTGRQPRALTFEKLTRNVPLIWAEQRVQFGFPS